MLKLWNRCRSRRLLVAGALTLGLAAPASAGGFYHYQTEDGVQAYTDDARRVPERYRGDAKFEASQSLSDYARHTGQDAAAISRYAERLEARIERLRAFNAEAEAVAQLARAGGATTVVRAGGLEAPTIEVRASEGDEPVVVEKRRYRTNNSFMTRHLTTVRQGDKLLAIVKPARRGSTDLFDVRDEATLGR